MHKKAGTAEIEEKSEGNMLSLLIGWANKDKENDHLVDEVYDRCGVESNLSNVDGVIFALSILSKGMLDRMIEAASNLRYAASNLLDSEQLPAFIDPGPLYWRKTISFDRLCWEHDGFRFSSVPTVAQADPMDGWNLEPDANSEVWGNRKERLSAKMVKDAFIVFDKLRWNRNGPIDPRKIRVCGVPECGKYFILKRGGQRESKACSKAHGNVLSARRLRASPAYLEKGRTKNTERMRAVREAEKLVQQWTNEGHDTINRQSLLWKWNAENGSILGKRAIAGILEKGSGTLGTFSIFKKVPDFNP